MSRAHQLCWWLGFALYLILGVCLYQSLEFFPNFHEEHAELIYSIAWIPLGAVAWWVKNRLEDWIDTGPGQ